MAKAGYNVRTTAACALAAATAKTVLMVLTPAQFGGDLKKIRISFDGVTASAIPVLCEIISCTLATNSTVGTANTNENANIFQGYGRSITTGFTAFSTSTSEPTVSTTVDSWLLTPNGGLLVYDFPLGDTIDWPVSAGMGIRCTAPAIVNVRAAMWFERC